MGNLFKVSVKTINEHLINLFSQKELQKEATIRNFRIVQKEGEREVYTAAELIVKRAKRMGLNTWKNAPDGKILKPDVIVAKNYLTETELKSLDRFVTMYLDYAEDKALRNISMTMKDWAEKLNAFLQFNERDILDNPGKVSKEVAKTFAESEFEKYRVVQDRLFESDFDKHIKTQLATYERVRFEFFSSRSSQK